MRFRDALKYALKYHTLAFVPTLLALAVAGLTVWFGVGQYVANALSSAGGSPTALVEAVATALLGAANPLLVVAGLVVAYFVRRVGKTALLVRTQAQAVEAARAEAAAGGSPDGSPATTTVEEGDTSADDGAAESPTAISDDAEPAITESGAGEASGDGTDDSAGDDGSDGDDNDAGGTGSGYDDTWTATGGNDDER
jgi:phosphotransferase system  glucose/maltose/N-acetylglucosamine-specific IIC component